MLDVIFCLGVILIGSVAIIIIGLIGLIGFNLED